VEKEGSNQNLFSGGKESEDSFARQTPVVREVSNQMKQMP